MVNLPAAEPGPPWTVTSAARVCRLLVVPMTGAAGVALTKVDTGRIALAFCAAALILVVACFAGPTWMYRTGRPGGVVAVAVAQLVGSLCAIPGTVPPSVLSPRTFEIWLLFAPLSLFVLIVLWLPSSRAWLGARTERWRSPATAQKV